MNAQFPQLIKEKSNDELKEIYLNKGNYDPEFYSLAYKELIDRNIDLNGIQNELDHRNEIEIDVLSQGKQGNMLYMVICLIFAVLGGVIGIVGGYIYSFSKVRDTEGHEYYTYNEDTRKFGKIIFYIGIAVFIITVGIKLNNYQP